MRDFYECKGEINRRALQMPECEENKSEYFFVVTNADDTSMYMSHRDLQHLDGCSYRPGYHLTKMSMK